MARSKAARDRQGGGKGQSRSSQREVGQYGNTRPREDKSVRRARGRQTDGRWKASQEELAEHERKLAALEARLAGQPHVPYRPSVDQEAVTALVERSTAESGVPLKVEDPEAIDKVATLLNVKPLHRISAEQMAEAVSQLVQGYHVDRVAARTGVPVNRLSHLVGPDGYAL